MGTPTINILNPPEELTTTKKKQASEYARPHRMTAAEVEIPAAKEAVWTDVIEETAFDRTFRPVFCGYSCCVGPDQG